MVLEAAPPLLGIFAQVRTMDRKLDASSVVTARPVTKKIAPAN